MPLTLSNIGDRVKVLAVKGTDAVRKHLGSLGIIPGAVVSVVQAAAGNLILAVHDSRIGINTDLANRVIVGAAV